MKQEDIIRREVLIWDGVLLAMGQGLEQHWVFVDVDLERDGCPSSNCLDDVCSVATAWLGLQAAKLSKYSMPQLLLTLGIAITLATCPVLPPLPLFIYCVFLLSSTTLQDVGSL